MKILLAVLLLAAAATAAHAQGVAPGGPIGGSTGIGSGIGPGSLPGGGTGPSYPNGTTAPATAAPIPPGGYPPSGRFDTGPSGQVTTRAPATTITTTTPQQYPQPRDPYGATNQPRVTATTGAVATRIAMVASSIGPAKVTAINQATRQMTLAFPDGRSGTYKVAGDVVNFGQVKVGDTPDFGTEHRVNFALPGVNMTAPGWTVVSTDAAANRISVVDPTNGQVRAFEARTPEGRAMLPQLKPGDRLTAFATELVVLSIAPRR